MSSEDLVAYLRARLDEEEAIARAASRPYRYADDGSKAPGTGVHWRWVTGGRWLTAEPDPVVQEFVADGDDVNLATVEEWPSTTRLDDGAVIHTRMMPETYAHSIVEMDAAAGLHIARHDPVGAPELRRPDRGDDPRVGRERS